MEAAPTTPRTLDDYRRLGQEHLEAGAPLLAYDALADGLAQFPDDVRLRQLLGLALARTGASRSAIRLLTALRAEGHADEETLGLLARVHKDLWRDSIDPAERRAHLEQAFEHYRDAYRITGGFWSGINAATMALMLDDRATAAALAVDVRGLCLRAMADSRSDRYWLLATLGEASLILGEWSQAEDSYAQAAEIGRGRIGDLASTRRNARLILRQIGVDGASIERSLRVPRVVAFAGHLLDRPGRQAPRFPAAIEAAVRTAIRSRLVETGGSIGYASAACGADIIFLETLLELNGDVHVVLPYRSESFINDSVDIVEGGEWRARYHRVLERACEVVIASDQGVVGPASYEYAFRLLDGMAGLRADALDTELVSMAVWDGNSGDGPGGTAATVAHWRGVGREVDVIDLAEILRRESPAPVTATPPAAATTPAAPSLTGFDPHIVSLLFADARGFSKLTEDQIPAFVHHFLGVVADEIARAAHLPIVKNTWGDGLHFVFENVRDAGQSALAVSDAVGRTDWSACGLPADLSLRIGLHAGPAYACVDPVTGRSNYFGVHVSRAARIEPITPPGEVYGSRAFAALARSAEVREFRCEYVGQTQLAKSYGTYPMYLVRRAARSTS